MKALSFLVVLLAVHHSISAQELRSQLRLAEARNWFVRLSTDTSEITQGRVRFVTGNRLLVGNVPVEQDAIRRIERRLNTGGGWKAGGLLGAALGASFGYGLGGLCERDCGGARLKLAAVMAIPGGVIGGVLGELIRPPAHSWQPVWP